MNISTTRGRANRLKVFRVVKEYMDAYGRSPTAGQVAEATGLSRYACLTHMQALHNADGLDGRFLGWKEAQEIGNEERWEREFTAIPDLVEIFEHGAQP